MNNHRSFSTQSIVLAVSRLLIGVVLFINFQCALLFLFFPQDYTASFEVSGVVGWAIVRGFGVLFLMWNVPYVVALLHPFRHRLALWEATAMQTIGLVGETAILATIPAAHAHIQLSILRFILFDGAGLVLLIAAVWLTRQHR